MADEMLVAIGESGLDVYAVLTDAQSRPYRVSTTAFEAHDDSRWADYALPALELGSSGRYAASMPGGLSAGSFGWTMYERMGASPAPTDDPVGAGQIEWDGTAEVPLISRLASAAYVGPDNAGIATIQAKTDTLPASPAAVGSPMTLDLTQAIPTDNIPQTVGDALNAARAEGFGRWTLTGLTLTPYAADGITPVHIFLLDDADNPTSRT